MEFQIDMGLVYNICAIAALMLANVIFRIAVSIKIGDFDFEDLWHGVIKYVLTLFGVALLYTAGLFCPEAGVELGGEMITIDTALNLIALALIGVYVAKCFENIKDIFKDTDLVLLERTQKSNRGL